MFRVRWLNRGRLRVSPWYATLERAFDFAEWVADLGCKDVSVEDYDEDDEEAEAR
jgi:hypothetical protein